MNATLKNALIVVLIFAVFILAAPYIARYFVPFIFLLLSLLAYVSGFGRYHLIHTIQNLPTSTVRSVAMGLVEVHGTIASSAPQRSPFSGKDYVFARFRIDYSIRRRDGHLSSLSESVNDTTPFFVQDTTGRVPVDLTEVWDVDCGPESRYAFETLTAVQEALLQRTGVLEKFSKRTPGGFWNIKESLLLVGTEIDVIGHAMRNPEVPFAGTEKNADAIVIKAKPWSIFYIGRGGEKRILKNLKSSAFWSFAIGIVGTLACIAMFMLTSIA